MSDAKLNAALNLAKAGETDQARAMILELGSPAENASVAFGLGLLALQMKNVGDAEKFFNQTVQIDPTYADAHYLLGTLALGAKNKTKAAGYFKTALAHKPGHPQAAKELSALEGTPPKPAQPSPPPKAYKDFDVVPEEDLPAYLDAYAKNRKGKYIADHITGVPLFVHAAKAAVVIAFVAFAVFVVSNMMSMSEFRNTMQEDSARRMAESRNDAQDRMDRLREEARARFEALHANSGSSSGSTGQPSSPPPPPPPPSHGTGSQPGSSGTPAGIDMSSFCAGWAPGEGPPHCNQ